MTANTLGWTAYDKIAFGVCKCVTRSLRNGRVPGGRWAPYISKLPADVVAIKRRVYLLGKHEVDIHLHTSDFGTTVSTTVSYTDIDGQIRIALKTVRMDADCRELARSLVGGI